MKKIFTLFAVAFCSTAFGQLINGGMETWRTLTVGGSALTDPVAWNSPDSIVYTIGPVVCPTCMLSPLTFMSGAAHAGSYAAEIMTKNYGGTLGYTEGFLTNCQVHIDMTTYKEYISGGSPTTVRNNTVTAWIKYVPRGGDSGQVTVQAVLAGAAAGGTDSVVGTGQDVSLPAGFNYILSSSAYAQHTYTITYTNGLVVPDHIQIGFETHIKNENDSSAMYIDDVAMTVPGPSRVQLLHSSGISCYPNPAGNALHIQTADHVNTTAELYNMLGQRVTTQPLTDYITDLDISKLSPGTYAVRLLGTNSEVIYKTEVVKQ